MTPIHNTKLSHIIEIPKIADEGSLSFMEGKNHIPFELKRIYYIYDVFKNAVRGRHAHRELQQVLFCIRGSITVVLDNGTDKEAITLNKPNQGLFLDTYMWHEMVAFKEGTVLLVVASDVYKESDYIRDYQTFLQEVSHDSHE